MIGIHIKSSIAGADWREEELTRQAQMRPWRPADKNESPDKQSNFGPKNYADEKCAGVNCPVDGLFNCLGCP